MSKKALCISCGMEFPSEEAFQAHKDGGHKTKGDIVSPVTASLPNQDFIDAVNRIEKKDTPSKEDQQKDLKMPEPKPISLTYLYVGECPTCRGPVTTLEIDIEKIHMCICYCNNCKKQLESRKVEKL